jgi:hypothetical protein
MFSTISRKLIRPVICPIAIVTNCDQREAFLKERPE